MTVEEQPTWQPPDPEFGPEPGRDVATMDPPDESKSPEVAKVSEPASESPPVTATKGKRAMLLLIESIEFRKELQDAADKLGSRAVLSKAMGLHETYLSGLLNKKDKCIQIKTHVDLKDRMIRALAGEMVPPKERVLRTKGKKKVSKKGGSSKPAAATAETSPELDAINELLNVDFGAAPPVEISVGATKITLELVAPGEAPAVLRVGNLRVTLESFATE